MSNVQVKYRDNENRDRYLSISKASAYILITLGISLLAYIIIPIAWQYIKIKIPTSAQQDLSLTKIGNSNISLYNYNKEASYIKNVIDQAKFQFNEENTKTPKNIQINTNYNNKMYIDIPAVNIKNIQIVPNVESTVKENYMKHLENGLAHFKYTAIPGDGGNSVIYGHSTTNMYFKSHKDNPEVILTNLKNIEIGDMVHIRKENKQLNYTVVKQKVVESTDLSILEDTSPKETITLMTCYPWGTGTHRYIVIAEKL